MTEIESKYYADGEDAFAMRRDLVDLGREMKKEKENTEEIMKDLEDILSSVNSS